MAKIMVQFRGDPDRVPSLDEVAARFGTPVDAFDETFAVITTDSAEGLFTVLVEEDEARRWQLASNDPAQGVFGNPTIAPTHQVKKGKRPE